MNVWIMNLRDNREVKTEESNRMKFDFCKKKGIIGIGWVGYDESSNDNAYLLANKYIDEFEIGDLVWTKDYNNEYYLCKITSKSDITDDKEMHDNDISKFCECEYTPVVSLPEGIENKDLIARHTIEKGNEAVSNTTEAFFNSDYTENNVLAIHNTSEKKSFFTGKNIKVISLSVIFIVSIILIIWLAETDNTQNKVQSSNAGNIQKQESNSNIKSEETENKGKISNDVPKQKIGFIDIYNYTVEYSKENNIGEVSEIFTDGALAGKAFYYYDRRIMMEGFNAKLSYHLYPELEWELSHDESKFYSFVKKMMIPYLCLSEEKDTQALLNKILTGERKTDYYKGDPIDVAYIYHGEYWDIALVTRVSNHSFGDSFFVTASRNYNVK